MQLSGSGAQVNPPVPAPTGPVNPPASLAPVAAPAPSAGAEASATPALSPSPCPTMVPAGPIGPTPVPCVPGYATPQPSPTQPPILVDNQNPAIVLGSTMTVHVQGAAGTLVATPADASIVSVNVDQTNRTLQLTGLALGTTILHLADDRGVTRDLTVRVAYLAGSIAPSIRVRLTGDPATAAFVKGQVAEAVMNASIPRAGATVRAFSGDVNVRADLRADNIVEVDVPVLIEGPQYIPVQGSTHVTVENFALPSISPSDLLVSDYPETLRENGVLFTADLTREVARRFLYYHFNPNGQPARRVLLKVQNPGPQPAVVQFISGSAGPETNEMEVGHLSTRRFLVRELQNEGTVITIPGNTTVNLVNHLLPEGSTVSAILQLREVTGAPLKLTLIAQGSTDPIDTAVDQSAKLLKGDVPHARGVYPVPEFYYNYTWQVGQEPLDIPIGTLKLPNLREGEALAGDYGVVQSIALTIVNNSQAPAPVALYESPRGGRATGTYIIDHVLVQAHAVASYAHVKLREYTVPARGFVRVQITTMPEGGSSYPLLLEVAPDDGGASPGAPNSPVY